MHRISLFQTKNEPEEAVGGDCGEGSFRGGFEKDKFI